MKTYLSKFQLIIGFIVILFANAYADAPLNESGKKLTGDFVLSLTDFKLQAQNGKHNQLQCQPNSIPFKPQTENQRREININQLQ